MTNPFYVLQSAEGIVVEKLDVLISSQLVPFGLDEVLPQTLDALALAKVDVEVGLGPELVREELQRETAGYQGVGSSELGAEGYRILEETPELLVDVPL